MDEQLEDPVYVDLDGTLISSDTLWESLCALFRERPSDVLRMTAWLSAGRAAFKREVCSRASIDARTLPYRPEVLDYLRQARDRGRRIVLATGSDSAVARSVADHLDLFDDILASDGETNLKGPAKRRAIEAQAANGYEYLGNSVEDVEVWRGARQATLVAPSRAARSGSASLGVPSRVLVAESRPWSAALRALRPHQWVKNALLFAPLLLAHQVTDLRRLASVVVAFTCFCAIASATYLVNDLLDIEADRQHPRKRLRPFASGRLSIPFGVGLALGLLVLAFGASLLLLSAATTGMLLIYALLTTAYSLHFKKRLFLDVLMLAGLYTHRVLTGGVAGDVSVSPWLLVFSTFFFLSLALVKRYTELLGLGDEDSLERRDYRKGDIGLVENMGITSGFLSVLVLGLYVSSDRVRELYPNPELLWLVSPIMLYWITRIWFLARRDSLPDDPVLFAATDRASYAAGALVLAVGALAAW